MTARWEKALGDSFVDLDAGQLLLNLRAVLRNVRGNSPSQKKILYQFGMTNQIPSYSLQA